MKCNHKFTTLNSTGERLLRIGLEPQDATLTTGVGLVGCRVGEHGTNRHAHQRFTAGRHAHQPGTNPTPSTSSSSLDSTGERLLRIGLEPQDATLTRTLNFDYTNQVHPGTCFF